MIQPESRIIGRNNSHFERDVLKPTQLLIGDRPVAQVRHSACTSCGYDLKKRINRHVECVLLQFACRVANPREQRIGQSA
jgi:hypothetical protein